jgi:hypothetical protein
MMGKRSTRPSARFHVERDVLDLAERRTEFLMNPVPVNILPLRRLLACAYVQGMRDAAESLDEDEVA